MDIIFEAIVEFFAEVFGEGFLSASTEAVPYDKLPREKRGKYKSIVVVVSAILSILLIIGVVMLLETKGKSELGKILIGFPIVYFLTAVILLIKKLIKRNNK